ncbi:hypothetical protein [uncultured Muribaculum sp.]|uniref:hypothetical protein n=1 Tax=uncultured Muribaculum sp. TaxID=1918613 RepID=UPI00262E3998|nr:hypothetical protein [uncultured Muribaculum sp.]
MKRIFSIVSLAAMLFVMMSCGKKMQDYDGYAVVESDPVTNLAVFSTGEGLQGLAQSDGEVIIKPEYQEIHLYGNFVTARLSNAEFDKAVKKMAEDAGINKDTGMREGMKRMENARHEFIVPGYQNGYIRLFNTSGKMLKDYAFQAKALWIDAMGDSIVWKTERNVDSARDAYQLLDINGNATDIEDFRPLADSYSYTAGGTMYFKNKGSRPVTLYGSKVNTANGVFITHDRGSYLAYLNIFTGDGKPLSFGDWTPVGWKEGPDGNGIFVLLAEGDPEMKRPYAGRIKKVVHVTSTGVSPALPAGYSVSNPGEVFVNLNGPDGRMAVYRWND